MDKKPGYQKIKKVLHKSHAVIYETSRFTRCCSSCCCAKCWSNRSAKTKT